MKKAKILLCDMDDVIADFYKAARCSSTGRIMEELMWTPRFFLNLEPIPAAQWAITQLEKMGFEVWICTQPLAGHAESYSDKALWIQKYFPSLYKRIIMTQDKGLKFGHYLIDDNAPKWKEKFENNGGMFIHFPYGGYNQKDMHNPEELWYDIVDMFKNENPYLD